MTMKLSAINRWCVTGTPVQRDLLGMDIRVPEADVADEVGAPTIYK